MRVNLKRSGGIAGLRLETSVDSAELPATEADRLRRLVEQLDAKTLAQRSPLHGPGADRFQYDVTIVDEDERHAISVSEDLAPPELRELISWLLERARQ